MINLSSTAAKRAYLLETIRESMRFERGIYRRATPLIDLQARHAAKRYEETEDLIETVNAVLSYDAKWSSLISWQHNRVGEHVGKKFYNTLKSERHYIETKDFASFRAQFMSFVDINTATKVKQIQGTTVDTIRKVIANSIGQGLAGYEIAKGIIQEVSGIGRLTAKVRSRLIARTETHAAYNNAGQISAEESGYDLDKEWMSAEDDRTREDHFRADGQQVDLKEPFIVGGEQLMYPGDPNGSPAQICNCRCSNQHISRTFLFI